MDSSDTTLTDDGCTVELTSSNGGADGVPTATERSQPEASFRGKGSRRRMWAYAVAAALVLGGAVVAADASARLLEHNGAANQFTAAVADRAETYGAQVEALEALHVAEAALTADYPLLLAIATTLTDSTVADPAARADLLSKVISYAVTDLALDGAGTFVVDRPPVFTEFELEQLVAAESRPVSELTAEELKAQTEVLAADTKLKRSYIELIEDVTAEITAAAVEAADSMELVMVSAAEKGITLVWEKAPAETVAVVDAASALAPEDGQDLTLEDRAGLVSAYIAAVNTASAAHQAVLAQEAEAARQAAEEAERQAAAQRRQNNNGGGGGGNPSSRGSSGSGTPHSNTQLPKLGGDIGDGVDQNNGQCWTPDGSGGLKPCGGW